MQQHLFDKGDRLGVILLQATARHDHRLRTGLHRNAGAEGADSLLEFGRRFIFGTFVEHIRGQLRKTCLGRRVGQHTVAQFDGEIHQRQLAVNDALYGHAVTERSIPNGRHLQFGGIGHQGRLNAAVERRRSTLVRIIDDRTALRIELLIFDRLLVHHGRNRSGQGQVELSFGYDTDAEVRFALDVFVVHAHHIFGGDGLILFEFVDRPVGRTAEYVVVGHRDRLAVGRNQAVVSARLLDVLVAFEVFRVDSLLLEAGIRLFDTGVHVVQVHSGKSRRIEQRQARDLQLVIEHIDRRHELALLDQYLVHRGFFISRQQVAQEIECIAVLVVSLHRRISHNDHRRIAKRIFIRNALGRIERHVLNDRSLGLRPGGNLTEIFLDQLLGFSHIEITRHDQRRIAGGIVLIVELLDIFDRRAT